MLSPTLANYNICKVAYLKGAYEDIIVNNYYSDPDKREIWYYEEQLEEDILKEMPGTIPAFEAGLLQTWLRNIKDLSVLVQLDTNLEGYVAQVWKTYMRNEPELVYESDINYPLYKQALENGLFNALQLIDNAN